MDAPSPPPPPPPSPGGTSTSGPAPPPTGSSPPTAPTPEASLPVRRRSYGSVADPAVSLYEMLHIEPHCSPDQVEATLRDAQRWWNAQQANPKYRRQAGEALARLREARELLLDPIRRQEYDRHHQQFRQSFRARRWQPVRDLFDVVITGETCDHLQQDLLERFAEKRGLALEEFEDLMREECLKRGVRLLPPPDQRDTTTVGLRMPPLWLTTMMALSLLGILALPFFNLSRAAILLAFPFFNNLRLLMSEMTVLPESHDDSPTSPPLNGWDWLVGIAVLGGATVTALTDLYHDPLFSLGLTTAIMTWLTWLGLLLSHHRDGPTHDPPRLPTTTEKRDKNNVPKDV